MTMPAASAEEIGATPVEEIQPGEADAILRMIEFLKAQLTARYVEPGKMVRRDAHPKTVGLVAARFIVSPDCPLELRHGLFRAPLDSYDALIRFSNGAPRVQHDLAPDVRGMAIKLAGVRGDFLAEPGQDFMLATAEAFFGTNAVDFVGFVPASESKLKLARYFLGGLRLRGLSRFLSALTIPRSPLAIEYFSQTPYRLGPHCVKYRARPMAARSTQRDRWFMRPVVRQLLGFAAAAAPGLTSRIVPADAVAQALGQDLERGPVTFEFLVQRWPDLRELPGWAIEDATRTWPAPWVRVATIVMPPQTASAVAARSTEAERMTFTPWHAAVEHRPLGSINRARYRIYKTMSDFRNGHNAS